MAPVIPKPKPQQQANEAQAAVQQVQEVQEAEPAQEQVAQERVSQGELTIPERSIVRQMADRYHMEPKPFQHAVMDTCFPPSNKPGDRQISPAEFAAFLLIAFEHGLNPIRREIYGFRAKNGAIVPVVGVDGWANIVNQHKQMDGLEFDEHFSEGQNEAKDPPYAITCRIHRKDRNHPIAVTEYLAECQKDTEPWKKWPRRMLRHKALIQCARVAFSFSGIYDPDEAERMGADVSGLIEHDGMRVVGSSQARLNGGAATHAPRITPKATQEGAATPGSPKPAEGQQLTASSAAPAGDKVSTNKTIDGEVLPPQKGEGKGGGNGRPSIANDPEGFISWLDGALKAIEPGPGCGDLYSKLWDDDVLVRLEDAPPAVCEAADALSRKHLRRLGIG
jgi:phage recombination protein Bet